MEVWCEGPPLLLLLLCICGLCTLLFWTHQVLVLVQPQLHAAGRADVSTWCRDLRSEVWCRASAENFGWQRWNVYVGIRQGIGGGGGKVLGPAGLSQQQRGRCRLHCNSMEQASPTSEWISAGHLATVAVQPMEVRTCMSPSYAHQGRTVAGVLACVVDRCRMYGFLVCVISGGTSPLCRCQSQGHCVATEY